ncbi:MAG: hypothetical protein K1W19_14205 [Lachnospiraceae bacterium]
MIYADKEYYQREYAGIVIPEDELEKTLKQASHHIDSLTYNRIVGRGFSNLTDFQQEMIKECCCEMADFEYDNSDMINSVFQQYSINGISMSFGSSWNILIQNGIAVRRDSYEKLCQTGLCCRRLGV